MNSSKKGEGVPLLNFEGGPGVPRSWVPGSWSHFYTMPGQPMPARWRRGRKEHLFYRTSPIG